MLKPANKKRVYQLLTSDAVMQPPPHYAQALAAFAPKCGNNHIK